MPSYMPVLAWRDGCDDEYVLFVNEDECDAQSSMTMVEFDALGGNKSNATRQFPVLPGWTTQDLVPLTTPICGSDTSNY